LLDDAIAEYDPDDSVPPEEVFSDPMPAEFLPEPPRQDAPAASVITANPFVWRDPKTIPQRQWLYGEHYIRRYLNVTVAPGGLGKSALSLVEAVAMATGRDLLGVKPTERCRVWVINLEDPLDELDRRIAAICLHYKVSREELDRWLFLNSGRDASICLARDHRGELVLNMQALEQLRETIRANKIDVVILDPFIGAHHVSENDNMKIKAVCHQLTMLAEDTNCAIGLVHHVRKPAQGQGETTANDARGAGALIDAARVARVLNRMTQEEATRCGIEKPGYFFRVNNGKANLTPPPDERSEWYRLINVPLWNGKSPSEPGDKMGVVEAWACPDPFQELSDAEIEAIQERVRTGEWRADTRANKWVGHAVAEVTGFDPAEPSARAAMKKIVNTLVQIGALKIVDRMDKHRELKKFVEVGKKWEVEEW
jgi:hypothetical protein